MDARKQIEVGKLVCPKTKQRLVIDESNQYLLTVDGTNKYPIAKGSIPILLVDLDWAKDYANSSLEMSKDYKPENLEKKNSFLAKLKAKLIQDYRTKASVMAFHNVFDSQPDDALCLSIGGGPGRPHPKLINMNIGLFPNVEIVADAHLLPYADESIDAIFCEAVLEHLYKPDKAVQEMFRVLKFGGKVFAATPFMVPYHGYPHHYQNFTLTGHKYLFESHNFEILDSGTCVGPIYTLVSVISTLIDEYTPVPAFLRLFLLKSWGVIGIFIRPLDQFINSKENAHVLAATTYLVAQKSGFEGKVSKPYIE